jgi:ERCC4-type nuclease
MIDKTKVVAGALENLILFHNIYILPTHSVKHTAQVLQSIKSKLIKQLHDEQSIKNRNQFSQLPSKIISMERKNKIMDNIFHHQLLLITGVSPDISDKIVKIYPTVYELYKSYNNLKSRKEQEEMLANISLGNRRLGNVLSKRIYNVYFT